MKNVLFLVVDCLRADRVQDAGRARVPMLERLRDEGLSFTQAISGASNTTPSFATMLTGRYPFVHGVRQLRSRLGPGIPVLPEMLATQGYRTIARVTGPLFDDSGIGRGFDDYGYREPEAYLASSWGRDLVREIRSFRAPWFMLLHVWELHWPRQAPLSYRLRRTGDTLYDQALSALDRQLRDVFAALPADTVVVVTGDHGERLDTTYDRADAVGIATYLARPAWHTLRRLAPSRFGKALDQVRRNAGLPDELHGRLAGFGLNDYLVRVPLVFWGPGVPKARRVAAQVRHVDIAPTILDLVGAAEQPGLERSLLTRGEMADRLAYSEASDERINWIACVRDGRWKYVLEPERPDARGMLFDVIEDPTEQRDVSGTEPQRAQALRERLLELIASGTREGAIVAQERPPEQERRVLDRLADLGYLEDR